MEHLHESVHGLLYYWEYIKRFGKESYKTWRKDFVIALLLAVFPIFLAWGDRSVLQGALLVIEAIGLLYGLLALRHFVNTSLILFRERAHPEYGGIRSTHWVYGVWGAGICLALVAGITYGAFYEWPHKLPPVVFNVPAPGPPTIGSRQVVSPPASNATRETKTPKHSFQTGALKTPTPITASQSQPQTPPQAIQSPSPPTFLDRVVQENRALSPDDRNRFSTELYESDQFIRQSQAVAYRLNAEFGKLSNDRQSRMLAKDVDDHIKFLRELDTSVWDQYHGLQNFQSKWQYFSDQTQYVFGDNPFNHGEGLLVNATEGMANALASWSKIANRDQQEILNIEAQQQNDFEANLHEFFEWANDTLQRIRQMRQSLDPNGTVQPLHQPVAPARIIVNSFLYSPSIGGGPVRQNGSEGQTLVTSEVTTAPKPAHFCGPRVVEYPLWWRN